MNQDPDKLMSLAAELGYRLMECGAEIYRVEDSMQRLLLAYGVAGEVFAIPNCIIVTLTDNTGRPLTQIRRVPSHGTDIELLEQYNSLCRQLCRQPIPPEQAMTQLKRIAATYRPYPIWIHLLGYFLGCGAFALFFGGTVIDGLCGGLCGVIMGLCLYAMSRLRTNPFFKTIIGALISAGVAVFLLRAGVGLHQNIVIIGVLMALVPGIAFTTAIRDIIFGDMVSGISRTVEALLIGVAIALGTALALGLDRILGGG